VTNAVNRFAKLLGVEAQELYAVVAGVNHQVWLLSLKHRGKDVYAALREKLRECTEHKDRLFTMELLEILGLYLMGGDRHIIEFFPHARIPTCPDKIGYGLKWRRDMITERMLSEELTKNADELAKFVQPDALTTAR
jgi:alpha-galactosidase